MASLPDRKGEVAPGGPDQKKGSDSKLGTASGVYIPVFLNVLSILMFLRFGQILGQIGFVGIISESKPLNLWSVAEMTY